MEGGPVQRGSRVWHVAYGGGVVETLLAGRRVRVRFDGAPDLPRTMLRAELRQNGSAASAAALTAPAAAHGPSAGASTAPHERPSLAPLPRQPVVHSAGPAAAAPPSPEAAAVRQTLEALRLGVVPSQHVEDYTVGRVAELRELRLLLEEGHGFRAVWGAYGAGKTHLLDVAEQMARERGFATARVVLDPLEMPPTHPKRLYSALVRSLRLPDSADVGLDPLLHTLCDSPDHRHHDGRFSSRFLSPCLHALHTGDAEAIAWMRDYVAGEEVDTADLAALNPLLQRLGWRGHRLLALSDFRTYGRVYLHLLGTLACWIRDAGHCGLLVLLDEVEYVDTLPRKVLGYAVQVLKHFAAATLPARTLAFDPYDHRQLYRGGHPVHRGIKLRFRPDQPLAVVCALTPLDEVLGLYEGIVRNGQLSIQLHPLNRGDLDELMRSVEALYRRAYADLSWTMAERAAARARLTSALGDEAAVVRMLVQGMVLVLDEHRYARPRHACRTS